MRKMQFCGVSIVITFILSLSGTAADQSSSTTLSGLPTAAQASISAAIGRDNPGYSAKAVASGFEATTWVQLAKLTASDGNSLGLVAISGNTVVAVPCNGSMCQPSPAAYVFVKPSSGWTDMTETAQLTTSDGAGLEFVAISGNTVVGSNRFSDWPYGAAYVFVKPASGWMNMTETAKLTSGTAELDCEYLGEDGVAISGGTVVVGCPDSYNPRGGAGFVFVKPKTGWVNMNATAILRPSDPNYGAVGVSPSISGNTVVLGAPYATVGSNVQQGAVYLFVKPATGWADMTETAKLTASDGTPNQCLGGSVAIHDDMVAAGVFNPFCAKGAAPAYVFVKPTTGWANSTETAKLIGRKARLSSVAISPNRVVVSNGVAALVFHKPASGWRTTSRFNAKINSSGSVAVKDWPPTVLTAGGDAVYVFGKQ
jgi:hypothetical protein